MNTRHNHNIDCFRALALLQILFYHAWALNGSKSLGNGLVTQFVALSGEIGVTAFFALSGYGIYCSINNTRNNGTFNYKKYLVKRFKRVAPPYYLCILLTVLLFSGNFISDFGAKHVVAHMFFIHNLFRDYHGSINGALWTMGTIVQFYLVAPILYKAIKKYGVRAYLCTAVITIVSKWGILTLFYKNNGGTGWDAFFAGRQLLTALDNFAMGMVVAQLVQDTGVQLKRWMGFAFIVFGLVAQLLACRLGMTYGVNTYNVSGYIWHSCTAVCVGVVMLGFAGLPEWENRFASALVFLAEKEYPIYLWHLPVYNNLLGTSAFMSYLVGTKRLVPFAMVLLMLSGIVVGWIMSFSQGIKFRFFDRTIQ